MRERYKPDKMMDLDIYPTIWDSESEGKGLGYLLEYFEELKSFVQRAADKGMALIIYLN